MKKFGLIILFVAVTVTLNAVSVPRASALPAINTQFKKTYEANAPLIELHKEAKCNVCHYGKSKKNRNDYGKAVSKFFTKKRYNEVKKDKEQMNKEIDEALKKAELEKNADGETYKSRIEAGKLPGTAPEEE